VPPAPLPRDAAEELHVEDGREGERLLSAMPTAPHSRSEKDEREAERARERERNELVPHMHASDASSWSAAAPVALAHPGIYHICIHAVC
jgi:hypothetical protein